MSDYKKVVRHPQTNKWEVAQFKDNYFGQHYYGVYFESDEKVYPNDLVQNRQLKEFWAADVIEAFKKVRPFKFDEETELLAFLNELEIAYKNRWERDPVEGEGAA